MSSANVVATVFSMAAVAIGSAIADGRTSERRELPDDVYDAVPGGEEPNEGLGEETPSATPDNSDNADKPPVETQTQAATPAKTPTPGAAKSADGTAHGDVVKYTYRTKNKGRQSFLTFGCSSERKALTIEQVVKLLANKEASFVTTFSQSIRETAGLSEVFLCTQKITKETLDTTFGLALTDASGQIGSTDASWEDFGDKVSKAKPECSATSFPNLPNADGKSDAVLVVPTLCSSVDTKKYGTLCGFLRTAPDAQILELWCRVAKEAKFAINTGKFDQVWIVTDGRSVPWLHVRIDSTPKYVQYRHWK